MKKDKRRVPFARAPETGAIAGSLKEAFESDWIGTGVYVRLFEQRIAKSVGRPFASATNSGTAALHLALKAIGVEGHEVLTTPLTVAATNHAILYNRAVPVFCDVEEDTGNVDVRELSARLGPRTRAILVVHLNGHSCDMDPILELARRRRLAVVEDACAALPMEGCYKGRPLGSMGDLGCFSFSGLKTLTTMDGGAVVHSRSEWAPRLSRWRNLGQRVGVDGPELSSRGLEDLGFHYRMNDVAAAIGLAQLNRWAATAARLRAIAASYRRGLAEFPGIEIPGDKSYALRSPTYFPIRVRSGQKARLRAVLREQGIETGDWLYPNHLFRLYRPYHRELPVAERLARELMYLPYHPRLEDWEIDRVLGAVRRFMRPPRARARRAEHRTPQRVSN